MLVGTPQITTEELISKYMQGESLSQLADLVGVNPTTIKRWLLAEGVKLRPRGRQKGQEWVQPYTYRKRPSLTDYKRCSQCKICKLRDKDFAHKGLSGICKLCHNDAKRLKTYGITGEEFRKMVDLQGGVCRICNGKQKNNRSLAVDHCHETGKNRGLLCNRCNMGLGYFKDDATLMLLAIEYLKKYL